MAKSNIPIMLFDYIKRRYTNYMTENIAILAILLDVHAIKIIIKHDVSDLKHIQDRTKLIQEITRYFNVRVWWMNQSLEHSGVSMFE
jgi:uncharacterized protein YdaL